MADLKRKLNILQHLSPAISEKQPRTQTKCGGLLMMTLFPVAVIIYSLVWFNNWFVSDAGALQVVEWKQFGDNGVPLEGRYGLLRQQTPRASRPIALSSF